LNISGIKWPVPAYLVWVALLIGCNAENSVAPEALVIYPAAKEVKRQQIGETWQVYYEVPIAYPADPVLKHIGASLAKAGWQPLPSDFLNPHLPSSHQTGWGSFVDATTKPNTKVHQWLAQWKNPQGEVVFFALQYRYEEKGTPDLNTLRVYASHSPRQIAELQSKAAGASQPSNK
jgi:hypothetical protein